jgi:hypothetical protein
MCLSLGCATAPRLAGAGESGSDHGVNSRPRRFGESGELAIAAATEMNLEHADASPSSGFPPLIMLFIESAVDEFVTRGLSLGARVSYEHLAQRGFPSVDLLSAGPRIGYNVSIEEHWSFWPVVYGAYEAVWDGGASAPTISLGAYAPVLFHPVPHFFFGLGPYVATTLATVGATRTPGNLNLYGLSLTLGGWLET